MKRDKWELFADLSVGEFVNALDGVTDDMKRLLRDKRLSYGPSNLAKFGDLGVLVRTSDKIERLAHMHREGIEMTAVRESAEDAWSDIVGYGLLVLVAYSMESRDDEKVEGERYGG